MAERYAPDLESHSETRMRVLVTGSSGRIGRAIRHRLGTEHTVEGLDRIAGADCEWCGDLCDPGLLRQALDGKDAVVHVAALHAPHVGRETDAEFERINVLGTRLVAEAAVEAGVAHLVFTSTTALYGSACAQPDQASWIDEETPTLPQTIYHETKLAAEHLLLGFAERRDLRVSVLRMSRCFPEPAPVMAVFRLHRGIDARDVADAHSLALARPPAAWRRLLVCSPTPFDSSDLIDLKRRPAEVLRRRVPELAQAFFERGWPLPASIDRVYDGSRASSELGWHCRYDWQDVLQLLDAGSPEVREYDPQHVHASE